MFVCFEKECFVSTKTVNYLKSHWRHFSVETNFQVADSHSLVVSYLLLELEIQFNFHYGPKILNSFKIIFWVIGGLKHQEISKCRQTLSAYAWWKKWAKYLFVESRDPYFQFFVQCYGIYEQNLVISFLVLLFHVISLSI